MKIELNDETAESLKALTIFSDVKDENAYVRRMIIKQINMKKAGQVAINISENTAGELARTCQSVEPNTTADKLIAFMLETYASVYIAWDGYMNDACND